LSVGARSADSRRRALAWIATASAAIVPLAAIGESLCRSGPGSIAAGSAASGARVPLWNARAADGGSRARSVRFVTADFAAATAESFHAPAGSFAARGDCCVATRAWSAGTRGYGRV